MEDKENINNIIMYCYKCEKFTIIKHFPNGYHTFVDEVSSNFVCCKECYDKGRRKKEKDEK